MHRGVASTALSRMTHSGHRPDRNPAAQRFPAEPWFIRFRSDA